MRKTKLIALVFASVGIAPIAAPVQAAIFTVGHGTDESCTHHTIGGALVSAAGTPVTDEIRVARNLSYTNHTIHLTDWSLGNALIISGGWDTCADTTPSGTTVIDGRADAPVIEVDTTAGNTSAVTLRRLTLTGSGERGLLVEGNSTVTLAATVVRGNSGGGIRLGASTTVTVDFWSSVWDNTTAVSGGGVYCGGGHLMISGIIGYPGAPNVAAFSGGGIFADAGCDLDLLDGAIVQSNEATNGGGIYAAGGAIVVADAGIVGITTATSPMSSAEESTRPMPGPASSSSTPELWRTTPFAAAGSMSPTTPCSPCCRTTASVPSPTFARG